MTTLTTASDVRRAIQTQKDKPFATLELSLDIQQALLAHQETLTAALLELQMGQFSPGRPSMSAETQGKLREWQGETQ